MDMNTQCAGDTMTKATAICIRLEPEDTSNVSAFVIWTQIKPHVFMFLWSGRKLIESNESCLTDIHPSCNYKGLLLYIRLKVDHTLCSILLDQLWHNWCLPFSAVCLFVWSHWRCTRCLAQLFGKRYPSCPYKGRPRRQKRSCPASHGGRSAEVAFTKRDLNKLAVSLFVVA